VSPINQILIGAGLLVGSVAAILLLVALLLLLGMRAGWRVIQRMRASSEALTNVEVADVIQAMEPEFEHVTPEYVNRLSDSYLTEEDFA
jgi:hypothetical protein